MIPEEKDRKPENCDEQTKQLKSIYVTLDHKTSHK